jgi:hypothetical protein
MLSTFLLQLGAGSLLALLPVPPAATGRAFNRFVAGLAAGTLILGIAARGGGDVPSRPLWGLAAAAGLAASALAHLGRVGAVRLPLLMAAAGALPALALDALALAGAAPASGILEVRSVLDAVTSAWLLGTVLVAMVLGHSYLNIAGLAIGHLIRLCLLAMAAVGARTASAAWGIAADGAGLLDPWLGAGGGGDALAAVVLLQRVLFGIAGAGILTTMAWRSARLSATQSATGILYIGFVAVLVGELASRYLLFGGGRVI